MADVSDELEEVAKKTTELARLIQRAKHVVVFTGAGVSTSAKIPDFRGPNGVWTLQAEGKLPESITMEQAMPTATHMALVGLMRSNLIRCVVSQNVDGLHRRSGLLKDQLAELHGNCFVEVCTVCQQEHLRSFDVCEHHGNAAPTVNFHDTGRRCNREGCEGSLRNTIVNFGEQLPEQHLSLAMCHASKADLAIVLGSSMTVRPACDMPAIVAQRGGKLAIINLQSTPLDHLADLRISADSDTVMDKVMNELELPVPVFDESAFKACIAEDRHGKEVTVGHSSTASSHGQSRIFVTSPGMNGEDVVYHVEFTTVDGQSTDVRRAPFEVFAVDGPVHIRVHFLDQALAPVEVTLELSCKESSQRFSR
mmetsp:Transcript_148207/g.261384  ORF Transcript_148207/g.261384 Transcript_148207/m.261384 type:complete len:366 (+) Transcript_148207:82-1179(+)